jgi:hypothetical protein
MYRHTILDDPIIDEMLLATELTPVQILDTIHRVRLHDALCWVILNHEQGYRRIDGTDFFDMLDVGRFGWKDVEQFAVDRQLFMELFDDRIAATRDVQNLPLIHARYGPPLFLHEAYMGFKWHLFAYGNELLRIDCSQMADASKAFTVLEYFGLNDDQLRSEALAYVEDLFGNKGILKLVWFEDWIPDWIHAQPSVYLIDIISKLVDTETTPPGIAVRLYERYGRDRLHLHSEEFDESTMQGEWIYWAGNDDIIRVTSTLSFDRKPSYYVWINDEAVVPQSIPLSTYSKDSLGILDVAQSMDNVNLYEKTRQMIRYTK